MNAKITAMIEEGKPTNLQMEFLLKILQTHYSKDDLSSCKKIAELLNKDFGTEVTEDDVVNYYSVALETEDRRLLIKTLGISY